MLSRFYFIVQVLCKLESNNYDDRINERDINISSYEFNRRKETRNYQVSKSNK